MYKLFHSGLQPPDLELHGHQLVGAHDGLMVVSPAFSQLSTARLLGLEVFRILDKRKQRNRNFRAETDGDEMFQAGEAETGDHRVGM